MKRTSILRSGILGGSLLLFIWQAVAFGQTGAVDLDTVRAGRFDTGKMWTFEHAPKDYFSQTYGFAAGDQWFEQVRLRALRVPGCSASFVSPSGLMVTNHHCVRSRVVQLSRPGESLLENGFFAESLAAERRMDGYYADQLIAVQDVSAEIFAAADRARTDEERRTLRAAAVGQIERRLREQYRSQADSLAVQVIALYAGGRHSAYVFRRFTDIRLVMAVEMQIGAFGGDYDNFTYPRHDLDYAFLRAYGPDGRPLASPDYFKWSQRGVRENDAVFVIGNPGPTTRMNSVAQLEFIRDVQLPAQIAVLQNRWNALNAALQANPGAADAPSLVTALASVSNTLKAAHGRLEALHDPVIMARRRDAERQFTEMVDASAELKARYGEVLTHLADVQQRKRQFATQFGLTYQYGTSGATPSVLRRAALLAELQRATADRAPADTLAAIRRRLAAVGRETLLVERALLEAQFRQWALYLPAEDSVLRIALAGRSEAEAAAALIATSLFADSARTVAAIEANQITLDDPALRLVNAFGTMQLPFDATWRALLAEETEWNAQLGRARFDIFGTVVAPDATSSPRITDGVVLRYEYNGTIAPPFTTFYSMYDRHASFGPGTDWDLPKRWLPAPRALKLATPLNFISTADTYGGNSGSPAVTKDLELVGLNFDRNINGLSRDYVYLPERGRNIMVDVRGIAASLDAVYGAHRVLLEATTGRLYSTEAAADAARVQQQR